MAVVYTEMVYLYDTHMHVRASKFLIVTIIIIR